MALELLVEPVGEPLEPTRIVRFWRSTSLMLMCLGGVPSKNTPGNLAEFDYLLEGTDDRGRARLDSSGWCEHGLHSFPKFVREWLR